MMNDQETGSYFELMELPISFLPDKTALRKKFLSLSKQFHPDYFAQADEEAQEKALEMSAQINKANKTLTNKEATIKYLLTLKGLLEEEEKYALPPDFLMEMMEINEKVADLSFDPDPAQKATVQEQVSQIENEIYEPVAKIIENYREGITTEKELLQVKDYYFKKKYLSRIYEAMSGML